MRTLDKLNTAGRIIENRKLSIAEQASRNMLLKDSPASGLPPSSLAPIGRLTAASKGRACSCCASFLLYVTCTHVHRAVVTLEIVHDLSCCAIFLPCVPHTYRVINQVQVSSCTRK